MNDLIEVYYYIQTTKSEYHIKFSNDKYNVSILRVHRTKEEPISIDESLFDYKKGCKDGKESGKVGEVIVSNFSEYITLCLKTLKGLIDGNGEEITTSKKVNQYRYYGIL